MLIFKPWRRRINRKRLIHQQQRRVKLELKDAGVEVGIGANLTQPSDANKNTTSILSKVDSGGQDPDIISMVPKGDTKKRAEDV